MKRMAMTDLFELPRQPSPFYSEEHHAFRRTVRRFTETEIEPFANEWDEAGTFPRELYKKAAEIGLLQVGYAEEYGGVPADMFFWGIVWEEISRAGIGGVASALMNHNIGLPPIVAMGSDELKQRVLPPVLSGEKISALAITEPSGGSDVANLKTTARRDGDHYVVNGSKIFISSGIRADFFTTAVRTGGDGINGISVLLIERDRPGFTRNRLSKMGWWTSDTAALFFDDVRVPVENLIGPENVGFKSIMANFNTERVGIAASALGYARVCVEEAVNYGRERTTFGKRLMDHQVLRHRIVNMAQRIHATQCFLELMLYRLDQGEQPAAEICLLKNQATETLAFCAAEALRIFGGSGYMRGTKVERIYREVPPNAIGGGTEDIMRDLAARQMNL